MSNLLNILKISKKIKPSAKKGFTIAELIVVIAIFSIITTVALLDQNRLDSGVLISNLGYETALAIREAQVYGVGVRNSGDNTFSGQYGAYFDMNSPTQIIVFADKDGDTNYSSGEEQYLYTFTNQRGNKITALCLKGFANFDVSQGPCTPASTLKTLRIIFKRPSLEANFYAGDGSGGSADFTLHAGPAYIIVNNIDGTDCRAVIVEPTGQIRVERSTDVTHACQ